MSPIDPQKSLKVQPRPVERAAPSAGQCPGHLTPHIWLLWWRKPCAFEDSYEKFKVQLRWPNMINS